MNEPQSNYFRLRRWVFLRFAPPEDLGLDAVLDLD